MMVTISRKKNLANKKSAILDKSGRFSSMLMAHILHRFYIGISLYITDFVSRYLCQLVLVGNHCSNAR